MYSYCMDLLLLSTAYLILQQRASSFFLVWSDYRRKIRCDSSASFKTDHACETSTSPPHNPSSRRPKKHQTCTYILVPNHVRSKLPHHHPSPLYLPPIPLHRRPLRLRRRPPPQPRINQTQSLRPNRRPRPRSRALIHRHRVRTSRTHRIRTLPSLPAPLPHLPLLPRKSRTHRRRDSPTAALSLPPRPADPRHRFQFPSAVPWERVCEGSRAGVDGVV